MKRIISWTLIFAILLAATACQPTPQEPIVVQKDVERMVEQAAAPQDGDDAGGSGLGIPEGEYTFTCSGLDGRLNIAVRATIQHPEGDKLPIVRVEKAGFSQQAVTGIMHYLFPDEAPYDVSGNIRTKAVVEEELLVMKKRLADGSYASEYAWREEQCREWIALLEAEHRLAPETVSEPVRSDGILRAEQIDNGLYYALEVSSEPQRGNLGRNLSVLSADPASREAAESGMRNHVSYHDPAAPEYTTLGIKRTDGTNVPEALTISFEEARALCDGLFASAGLVEDFCLGAAFLVDDRGTGNYSGSGKEMGAAAEQYAYKLYYTRQVQGIPTFVNANLALSGAEYAIPWSYESIAFTIGNSGITQLKWDNPLAVTEIIQEHAALKPFDEIIGIFETMVKVHYEAQTDYWTGGRGSMDITIDAVQLCLVRIREQNSTDATGLLVPAWVFYGNNKVTSADGYVSHDLDHGSASVWNKEPYPGLIINAVDGSLIDLERGY